MSIGYGGFSLRVLTEHLKGIRYFHYFEGSGGIAQIESSAKVLFATLPDLITILNESLHAYFGKRLELDTTTGCLDLDNTVSIFIREFRNKIIVKVVTSRPSSWKQEHFALLQEIDRFIQTLPVKPIENISEYEGAFVPLKD